MLRNFDDCTLGADAAKANDRKISPFSSLEHSLKAIFEYA